MGCNPLLAVIWQQGAPGRAACTYIRLPVRALEVAAGGQATSTLWGGRVTGPRAALTYLPPSETSEAA